MHYIFGEFTDKVYVIDTAEDKLVDGVVFNISPKNLGSIKCADNSEAPIKQFVLIYSDTECKATPTKGSEFVSWTRNINDNTNITLKAALDNNYL